MLPLLSALSSDSVIRILFSPIEHRCLIEFVVAVCVLCVVVRFHSVFAVQCRRNVAALVCGTGLHNTTKNTQQTHSRQHTHAFQKHVHIHTAYPSCSAANVQSPCQPLCQHIPSKYACVYAMCCCGLLFVCALLACDRAWSCVIVFVCSCGPTDQQLLSRFKILPGNIHILTQSTTSHSTIALTTTMQRVRL